MDNRDEPAYPFVNASGARYYGLTKHEAVAAIAIGGMLASGMYTQRNDIVNKAKKYADELLEKEE